MENLDLINSFNNKIVLQQDTKDIEYYCSINLPDFSKILPFGESVISYVEEEKLVLRISKNGDKSQTIYQRNQRYYATNGNTELDREINLGWKETEGDFMLVWRDSDILNKMS